MRAAGARAVGLYVINLSAPSTVQTAAYVKEVQVLPIITPGQSPPPVAGVPEALLA